MHWEIYSYMENSNNSKKNKIFCNENYNEQKQAFNKKYREKMYVIYPVDEQIHSIEELQ